MVRRGRESVSSRDVGHVEWPVEPAPTSIPLCTQWGELSHTYDPAGRRIEKKVDGTTPVKDLYACPELSEWDGHHCIAEHVIASPARQYDANDALLRKYVFGPCIDEPICLIEVADGNLVTPDSDPGAVFYYRRSVARVPWHWLRAPRLGDLTW
jgi:hypothetical protein